jgi:hypothetical protein
MRTSAPLSSTPLGTRSLAAIAAASLVGVVLACLGPVDTASKVRDLRILAVSSDPPDYVVPATWNPQGGGLPAIPQFDVRILLGDSPDKARTVFWRATICAKPDVLRCEGTDAGVDGMFVLGEGSGEPVGGLLEVQVKLGSPQQYVAGLGPIIQKAIEDDAYKGFGGMPIVVAVKVWADGEEIYGGKRVPLWLPIPMAYPEIRPNVMPARPVVLFGGVAALPGDAPKIKGSWLALDVFPVDPGLYEAYYVPNFKGTTEKLTESWTYAWYTTKGSFSPETTGGWNPILKKTSDTDTRLELPEGTEPGPFKVLCVVRDGRGGVTWTVSDAEFLGP